MSLYFFVNFLVREYINHGSIYSLSKSNIQPEWSVHVNDMHSIGLDKPNVNHGSSKITSDHQLANKLSHLILLDANDTSASDNKRYLYCELLFINKEINRMVHNKVKLTSSNLRYLFIVYYHYTLDNPLVILIRDLMMDQKFFIRNIKRIFNYPCFNDWLSIHNKLKSTPIHLNNKLNETELLNCFIYELYRTKQIAHFKNYTN